MLEEKLRCLLDKKDSSAFDYLYDKYASSLFGVICKLVKDRALAEKVLQKSFISLWQQSGSLKNYRGSLFIWMHNISRNIAMEELSSSIQAKSNATYCSQTSARWASN